ncbi:hypothetical protein IFM89_009125 [Coptis chinensis]|uniref:Uncharacterized protein n=1 Tax=Coptis chinensis TaxID=261450 RepID=A0A835LVD5_9MAGN|nr:hypothetical protein IFM89_009125 [Coptis chinensis]
MSSVRRSYGAQTTDLDGQEITLKLQRNGNFASFETLSGKSYELVSFASQVHDATVFQSLASDTKVGAKELLLHIRLATS